MNLVGWIVCCPLRNEIGDKVYLNKDMAQIVATRKAFEYSKGSLDHSIDCILKQVEIIPFENKEDSPFTVEGQ